MTPMAHRASARPFVCPGCATCRSVRRDRMLALAVIVVFVAVYLVTTALGWHG